MFFFCKVPQNIQQPIVKRDEFVILIFEKYFFI